jgi:ribonuclease VapC
LIFIDTSALIAILADEDDAAVYGAAIDDDREPLTSPAVILEASLRLSTMLDLAPPVARQRIDSFLATTGVGVMPIDREAGNLAIDAFSRYGEGRHPARLNFADCLSYACAKGAGARLLYKGNDFARTDMG